MSQNSEKAKFFCELTLTWFVGVSGCAGLFYLLTISGANEFHPLAIATFFGAIYFLYKIIAHAKLCLKEQYPSFSKPKKSTVLNKERPNIFGPILITIMFGPVGAWLLLVVTGAKSNPEKLLAMAGGMALFYVGSFLWLNKKT